MKEKVFIRHDTAAEKAFLKAVDDTILKGNEVLEMFNDCQNFASIDEMEVFAAMLTDPVRYYDEILLSHIDHDKRLEPNMVVLSSLYNVPRDRFLTYLGYSASQISSCTSCGGIKVTINKSKQILTFDQYIVYEPFLSWKSGKLCRNAEAIKEHCQTFLIYAESDQQVQLYKHYENLINVLNDAIQVHKLGSSQIDELARIFGLLVLNNKLVINDLKFSETIKYLN